MIICKQCRTKDVKIVKKYINQKKMLCQCKKCRAQFTVPTE